MEFKLQALSIYECGQRRDKEGNPHQEDWIYPSLGEINNDKDRLFILCDGMGGHAAGEVASAAVCEAMSKTINESLENGEKFSEELLLKAIDAAYNLLDERDTSEDGQKKMGTTMTFLMLHEGGATIAHIGDSRVYHIRPKTGKKEDLVFCTRDHSLVNDLIKIGELTEEEALNHPQKNVITRAMQPNLEHRHKADIVTTKNIRPGDYFYMCSDGMLEQTSDDNLCFMLANDVSDEEKRDMLIKVSKKNHDNHSAHLIHILDVQPESEIEDDPLPIAPPSVKEIEDDEDVVKPEFEESEVTEVPEETTNTGENTDVSSSETKEVNANDSSKKTAVEGGTETPATFHGVQRTTVYGGGRNKLMWRIIACVAIAILAICGVIFSKSSEKKEVEQPSVQETRTQKNQRRHTSGADAGKTSKPSKVTVTSSNNTSEQSSTTLTSSNQQNTAESNPSGSSQNTPSKPSQTGGSISATTNTGQTTASQSGQANDQSRLNIAGAAIQNMNQNGTGSATSSDENKVKQAENKKKIKK